MTDSLPPAARDLEAVTTANLAFYTAFEAADLEAMRAVWSNDPIVSCIHPGWAPLLGWRSVEQSFVAIFSNPGWLRVKPTDVIAVVDESLAWVRCIEVVSSLSDRGPAQGRVAATNLFRREDGVWKMILHHGSPMHAG